MSLVTWPDGLVRGPDGPCRQIPQPFTWSSVVMITRDGTARRRHYNAATREWIFDADPLLMAFDANGDRLGYHLASGHLSAHWVSWERAVLLAWAHRHPLVSFASTCCHRVVLSQQRQQLREVLRTARVYSSQQAPRVVPCCCGIPSQASVVHQAVTLCSRLQGMVRAALLGWQ